MCVCVYSTVPVCSRKGEYLNECVEEISERKRYIHTTIDSCIHREYVCMCVVYEVHKTDGQIPTLENTREGQRPGESGKSVHMG